MEPYLTRWWTRPDQHRPLPYMCAAHAAYLGDLAAKATLAVEWGAGGSTLFIACLMGKDCQLLAIESDPTWLRWTQNAIFCFERADFDMAKVALIDDPGCNLEPQLSNVDLVLVDGPIQDRPREMRLGWGLLRPGGSLLLHDAQRSFYTASKAKLVASGGQVAYESLDDMGACLWHAKKAVSPR